MRVVICDDEQSQIEEIRLLLQNAAQKTETYLEIREFTNPKTMLFETEEPKSWPDLLFLDVNMPQMMGTDVARALRKRGQNTQVIFFSVLQDIRILLQAFDVHASNYFIKGNVDVNRFNRIFADCVKKIEQDNQEALVFSCAGESRSVPVKDIQYFDVNRRIVTVHYGQKKSFEFYAQLGTIEETLRGRGFLRVHRSYLVAKSAIASVSGKEVSLLTGEVVPLSRSFASRVKEELMQDERGRA